MRHSQRLTLWELAEGAVGRCNAVVEMAMRVVLLAFALGMLLGSTACSSSRVSKPSNMDPSQMTPEQRAELQRLRSEAERKRRAQTSNIPGLSVGELEDMPPAPPLPGFITVNTTDQQLALHARLVVQSEYGLTLPATISPEARQRYLLFIWTPEMKDRQRETALLAQDRQAIADHFLQRSNQELAWREEADRRRRAYERAAELQRLGLDAPQR